MHIKGKSTKQHRADIPSSAGKPDKLLFDKSRSDNRNKQAFAENSVSWYARDINDYYHTASEKLVHSTQK